MLFIKFNKQPLRRKLLIIYIVGFLIPIVSINLLFSYNLYHEQVEFNRINFINSIEKVKLVIEPEIELSMRYISELFINDRLYYFLRKDYQSIREYLKEKSKIEDIERTLSNIRLQENSVQIYTTNNTIQPDNNFMVIDKSVSSTPWFRDFILSGKKVHVFFDSTNPYSISVIRSLNYRSMYKSNIIVKIDIPTYKFYREFNRLAINIDFSVISENGDHVLSLKSKINNPVKYKINFDSRKILDGWYIEARMQNYSFFNSAVYLGKKLIIFSIIFIVIFGSLLIYILSKSFYSRIYNLSYKIRNIRYGNFEEVEINESYKDEISELAISYNIMIKKIHELINEISEAKLREKNIEIVKRKAQINALRSQINPHYLFNVLESIRMKSLIKGEKETGDIIKHLSKSFRHIISWESNIITIDQEIGIAKDFLTVQKYRFGDKLDYEIDIDDNCKEIEIPKLTLQPFIENSCIHGIEKSSKKGKITISIKQIHDKIVCKIADNGVGISKKNLEEIKVAIKHFDMDHKHIGFSNAYWRLKNHYPELLFEIDTKEEIGTDITISIPLKKRDNNDKNNNS